MFTYSFNGVTAKIYRDVRKHDTKELCPIKINVNYKREQKYYSTGKKMNEEDWLKLPTSRTKEHSKLREEIHTAFKIVEGHIFDLISNEIFSFENLTLRLGKADSGSVNSALENKIAILRKQKQISSSDWYHYTLKDIEVYDGKNVKFNQVTVGWLKGLENYILEKGNGYTTVNMRMRALNKIINEAITAGYLKKSHYPFGKGKYEVPEYEARPTHLTLSEVAQLINYTCSTTLQERDRDMWVFLYLCNGANIGDVCNLKYQNWSNEEISFYRIKTSNRSKRKKPIYVSVTTHMIRIIEKWGNTSKEPDSYIFPFLNGFTEKDEIRSAVRKITKSINTNLKKIGEKLNLPHVTTNVARHTYANILNDSLLVDTRIIKEGMGHKTDAAFNHYIDRFDN